MERAPLVERASTLHHWASGDPPSTQRAASPELGTQGSPLLPYTGNLSLTPSDLEPQGSHCKGLARSSELYQLHLPHCKAMTLGFLPE